jgi:hypothetical protein
MNILYKMQIFRKNKPFIAIVVIIAALVVSCFLLHLTSGSRNKGRFVEGLDPSIQKMDGKIFVFTDLTFAINGSDYNLSKELSKDQGIIVNPSADYKMSNKIMFDNSFNCLFLKKSSTQNTVNTELTDLIKSKYDLGLNGKNNQVITNNQITLSNLNINDTYKIKAQKLNPTSSFTMTIKRVA